MTSRSDRTLFEGLLFLFLFCLTIPAANWMIGNVGTSCDPAGPCLLPVAPGLMAPSSFVAMGLAFFLRDLVQRRLGIAASLGAVATGAALSAAIASPAIVLASTAAFLLSELVDFAVYTSLRRRSFTLAVVASGLVAIVIDSVVFLWLAYSSAEFLLAQIVGKLWIILLLVPLAVWFNARDERLGLSEA